MASARDLITIFVALETISIPTFVLAAYRKHDRESNEAGVKYYLIGVLSSALMLYGMSLIFGYSGSTLLSDISRLHHLRRHRAPARAWPIFLTLVGFAFKVERSPIPLLGARYVRRRADARHRVPFGRVEGRRVRRPAQHHLLRLLRNERRRRRPVVAGGLDPRGRVDDPRQPRCAPPDQHRAHARVLLDRAGRLHARPVRGGGDRGSRGRTWMSPTPRSAPSSSTSSSTAR